VVGRPGLEGHGLGGDLIEREDAGCTKELGHPDMVGSLQSRERSRNVVECYLNSSQLRRVRIVVLR
jgi:hypothetical protein